MPAHEFDSTWYWKVRLDWTPSIKLSQGLSSLTEDMFDAFGIYRFERDHALRAQRREIVRIGVAHSQTIGDRLLQYKSLVEAYRRRGSLWLSYASLDLDDRRHHRARYEAVEHLLIFAMQPLENTRKRESVPDDFYAITNDGYRGTLPREIIYPLWHAA